MERMINKTKIVLKQGDITQETVNAIVNAANSGLLGGGGVDGAIHRAGGSSILVECQKIRDTKGRCHTGHAVITTAGNLKATYVIHAVGPIWHGGKDEEETHLREAYTNSLSLALKHEVKTIAFPSISTGAYGYPIQKAARTALQTVIDFVSNNDSLQEVRFVLFTSNDLAVYEEALAEF